MFPPDDNRARRAWRWSGRLAGCQMVLYGLMLAIIAAVAIYVAVVLLTDSP